MVQKKNMETKIKNKRDRINISLSEKKMEEYKMIILIRKKYDLKINGRMRLSGPLLFKHLMLLGLQEIDKKYGEVERILKKERLFDAE